MTTILDVWPATLDSFPYAQSDAIELVNEFVDDYRNYCIAIDVTDSKSMHCFVAVNNTDLDIPFIPESKEKDITWHFTKAPKSITYHNTCFHSNLIVGPGIVYVKLVNCDFESDNGGTVFINSGVREVDIQGNKKPIKISVSAK